ncbi:hypothetical protein [Aliikangiella sp. G2MR2-5]|uniref:hypothetical protein n=1 Tax=Aliikangiella sp. G2MR2-5 TaxID=2788943 RepID=UPI0018AB3E29|nr:hypothetical protein [Aliikangiella sp. G2MR2-5]
MSQSQNDWEKLQSEWQAYEPDFNKIKRKISWVTWRMYLILVIDVFIFLAYFPFLYYEISKPTSTWVTSFWYYFMGVLLVYGVYLDFKIRLPILRNQGNSAKEVLELYLKRTQAGVTLGKWGQIFCAIMLLFFWLWVGGNAFLDAGSEKLARPGFIAFGTIWILMFTGIFYWYYRKKSKEYLKLKILWREYLD